MGEDPGRIRQEIEQTREQMGETVDALGYKSDVKTRAKQSLQQRKDSLKESVVAAKDSVRERVGGTTDRVSEATPDSGEVAERARQTTTQAKAQARRAAGVAQENPIGLALGSVAVGFLAGLLVPSSRVEDEKVGPLADTVKDQLKETGQEALERGKQVAQQAAESAKQTAQESGAQHAQELKESAQQSAQEVTPG